MCIRDSGIFASRAVITDVLKQCRLCGCREHESGRMRGNYGESNQTVLADFCSAHISCICPWIYCAFCDGCIFVLLQVHDGNR